MDDSAGGLAGKVADLRARLTTAQQERDELRQGAFGVALTENGVLRHKLAAAEAERDELRRGCAMQDELRQVAEGRVEALGAVRDAAQEVERILRQSGVTDSRVADLRSALARAALACPPQQRGE